MEGSTTVTVTKREILVALSKPEDFILALAEVTFDGEVASAKTLRYLTQPFHREPDFAAASVNYEIKELINPSNRNVAGATQEV